MESSLIEDDEDEIMESENVESTDEAKKKHRGGRIKSTIWNLFTDAEAPSKLKSAICKHCKTLINHHKKSECAQRHLLNCSPFRKLMNGLDPEDRPDWYTSKKQKSNLESVMIPASSCRQRSIKDYTVPSLTAPEKNKLNKTLAMFFFKTGTSFVRIEDENLQNAFKICRSDVQLPTRKQLAGPLLDECFEDVKKQVNEYLASPTNAICITSDAWTNLKKEPIVNYMAISPTKTLFIESVSTGEQPHDANWIAADLSRVIDSMSCSVAGAITDNTAANKRAWKILEEKYPSKFFHGCASHGLHLLVKDIFATVKNKSKRGTSVSYSDDYPFEYLLEFTNKCKEIVIFFKNHHAFNHNLREAQKANKVPTLALPAPTRWGSINHCFKSLLKSEKLLHAVVNSRDFINEAPANQLEIRQNIKYIINSSDFIKLLETSLAILKPIDELIVKFQSDQIPVSDVYDAFLKLESTFDNTDMVALLGVTKTKYIKELVKSRFQFLYGDAHGLGYLMDPRYLGQNLEPELRQELEDFLINLETETDCPSKDKEERKEKLYQELTQFIISANKQKTEKTFRYQMLMKNKKTVLEYWLTDGLIWPCLQEIALRVFSLAASTAALERNFSTFGFIQSKLRISLGQLTAQKLVFIKTNANLFSSQDPELELEDENDFSDAESVSSCSILGT